jgi:hypothetical protein
MRRTVSVLVAAAAMAGAIAYVADASGQTDPKAAPILRANIPSGYREWQLISVAHEEDSLNDPRAILGNDIAVKGTDSAT